MSNRQEIKEKGTELVFQELRQCAFTAVESVIDSAYCDGYNTVLDAAEKVLSGEDYWKIVEYLNKQGK